MNEPWLVPQAAYIHIPFCAHQCGYCDFAVATRQDHQIDLYLDALEAEIFASHPPHSIATLFIGGGTPTHLDTNQLDRLFRILKKNLPLQPDAECSIEANPDDLTDERLAVLRSHGVTRVSIGVQTFQPGLLPVLDRRHRADQIEQAVARTRAVIAQVSLDLIFAVPGQTLTDWESDLHHAVELEPDHVSTYGLTFEKGTPLWKRRARGEVRSTDEDLELAMYQSALNSLTLYGYEHYEISNFAKLGKRCRHNEIYWANHAYFGFGMGAASYINGVRSLNSRNLHEYMKRALSGESTAFQSERLAPRDRAIETMAIQLRRSEGIQRIAFHEQTGFALDALVGKSLTHLTQLELIEDDGSEVKLTRSGKFVADGVIEKLMTTIAVDA